MHKATKEELKVRLHRLENNGKNIDMPGVVQKLRRQIRGYKDSDEK